jgi:16S rRNA (cytosine967-C5)-methyltransferase
VTPAARLEAAIEVLDRIASSRQPADQALKAWGAANRYAGSKDRKAVADRVYLCLRERGGHMANDGGGRRAMLACLALDDSLDAEAIAALFSGERHAPAPLTPEEHAWLARLSDEVVLPPLLRGELERSFGPGARAEADALLRTRAPLDIRINTLRSNAETVFAALDEAGIGCEPTTFSATGVRITSIADVLALDLFKAGGFEVQDEGSQIAAWLMGAGPGKTVVDYCAGGGGKTLALGQAMEGQGRLIACDLNPRRLDAIRPRLARAGVEAQLRRVGPTGDSLSDLIGQADRVLVDAPCSGSGVWRRRPEEAWRLTEAELRRLNGVQAQVLDKAAALVRPGGRLAYVTCSVLASENGDIAAAFAARHADFKPLPVATAVRTPLLTDVAHARLAELSAGGHTVQLSPRRTGTDGFFIALFERIS